MKSKFRKAFTLVELVVTVSILSVLSATAVATYIGVTKSAKTSNDELLVGQLNKILKLEEAEENKPIVPSDIVGILNDYGLDKSELRTSNEDLTLAWNQESNEFALFKGDKLVYGEEDNEKSHYWKFLDNVEKIPYSIYLLGENEFDTVTVNAGLDTGENKIKTIQYENNSATAIKQEDIRINSNNGEGTDLTVNAKLDTVSHYGNIRNLLIYNVAPNSYHEFGKIFGTYKVLYGRFVAEAGSEIVKDNNKSEANDDVNIETSLGTCWSSPSYSWDSENKMVTASRYDVNHPEKVEKEVRESFITSKKDNSCEEDGYTKLKVNFANQAFSSQEKEIKIKAHGHDEVEISAVDPTCLETGLTAGKRCTICERITEEQQIVEALGHEEEIIKGYEPTCLEKGLTNGKKCVRCGEVLKAQEEIAAHGHHLELASSKEANCTEDGYILRVCKECDYSETEVLTKLGHNLIIEKGIDITCESNGTTDKVYCATCGYVEQDHEVIENHDEHGICKVCQSEYLNVDWYELSLEKLGYKQGEIVYSLEKLQDEFNKAKYIKIMDDIKFSSAMKMTFTSAKVINLNNKTFVRASGENTTFQFNNCGDDPVVFLNGSFSKDNDPDLQSKVSPSFIRVDNSKLILDNIKFNRKAAMIGTGIEVNDGSTVTIKKSEFKSTGTDKNLISISNSSSCYIYDSTISGKVKVSEGKVFEAENTNFSGELNIECSEKVNFVGSLNSGNLEVYGKTSADIVFDNFISEGDVTTNNARLLTVKDLTFKGDYNIKNNNVAENGKVTVSNIKVNGELKLEEVQNAEISSSNFNNLNLDSSKNLKFTDVRVIKSFNTSDSNDINLFHCTFEGSTSFKKESGINAEDSTSFAAVTVDNSDFSATDAQISSLILERGNVILDNSTVTGKVDLNRYLLSSDKYTIEITNNSVINGDIEADYYNVEIDKSIVQKVTANNSILKIYNDSVVNGNVSTESTSVNIDKSTLNGHSEFKYSNAIISNSILNSMKHTNGRLNKKTITVTNTTFKGNVELKYSKGSFTSCIFEGNKPQESSDVSFN